MDLPMGFLQNKGDFGKRCIRDVCLLVEQLSVLFELHELRLHVPDLACTKARQSTGREL